LDLVADYVYKLRKALTPAVGRDVLRAVRPGAFRVNVADHLVDVLRFDDLVRQAAAVHRRLADS
jgi:two-component SAPR family response regulator